MSRSTPPAIAILAGALGLAGAGAPASAADSCVHAWAVPGDYAVTGQFRKRTQTTTASLSSSCRVTINVPGVFTGGPVQASGACVQFGFRVEGESATFTARWCDDQVVIPYNGRDVHASVRRIEPAARRNWNAR